MELISSGSLRTTAYAHSSVKLTLISSLRACAHSSTLLGGRQIHARLLKTGFSSDVAVQTTCIHFYANCKDITSARQAFDEMSLRTSVSWNAMITGYSSQGRSHHAREAFTLFSHMLQFKGTNTNQLPTETTMVGLLSASSHLGSLATGSCVHAYIHRTIPNPDDRNIFIGTALLDMYSKCGSLASALQVFERMRERNVLTWSAMMAGLAIHGQAKEALELLEAMQVDNIAPNAVTFTCLLSACRHAGLVEEGLHVFNIMSCSFGVTPQIQHYGCIVNLLGNAGLLEEAHKFIMCVPLKPDAVLWRTLLSACNAHGNVELGEKVGRYLLEMGEGSSNLEVSPPPPTSEDHIALSNLYASAERWDDVRAVREMMKARRIWNKPGCSSIHVMNNTTN